MDRLAHLELAGRPNDPARLVELQAGRLPLQAQEGDQALGMALQVANQLFVHHIEPVDRLRLFPVRKHPLVIGKWPRNVLPVVGPGVCGERRLPAG